MPGRRLNDHERRLKTLWDAPPRNLGWPMLRQLRISSQTGLRGIRELVVPLKYPLTAICGRNGVGKSTVLSLAALSASTPPTWNVYWGNSRPRRGQLARRAYSFEDFFYRGSGEPNHDGLQIGWVTYLQDTESEYTLRRQNGRFTILRSAARHTAPSRPTRAIDFLPISRVVPAAEFANVRSAFERTAAAQTESLTRSSLTSLSYIMGRQYEAGETRYIRGVGLASCTCGTRYSGFNMGAGEASLISLFSRLESLPRGGLMLIEELELGLHVEAQSRLIEVLIRTCAEQQIQLICTTHSEIVLDQLPREARVLLRRHHDGHEALNSVSTRFALHEMSGTVHPELVIYTEDKFAAAVVEEALPSSNRSRVQVRDIGSNVALARQSVSHLRSGNPARALTLFDGDCAAAEVERWIQSERGERTNLAPDWSILPGDGATPERWVVSELRRPEYRRQLSAELNCSDADAGAHVEAMHVQMDQHDAAHVLSRRTGLDQKLAERHIVRAVCRGHPALEPVRQRVDELLGRGRT